MSYGHKANHDPILGDEWEWCSVCRAARDATFAELRTVMPGLGPYDTEAFIRRMQELAAKHVSRVVPE